ncbi:primase-helicase zinc-binding domain-containing protein [Streptomyces mirabilis]|uniref:primase-helicase zinc-binding domain-containing protein n=1 Tax=Streptomyces mirabilis TaxID=68239 RepID=UPI0033AC2461
MGNRLAHQGDACPVHGGRDRFSLISRCMMAAHGRPFCLCAVHGSSACPHMPAAPGPSSDPHLPHSHWQRGVPRIPG